MIFHKYITEGKPICKIKKTPVLGLWFVQDNDYKKLSITDELCQNCWTWQEELSKLDDDITYMEAHPNLYTPRQRMVLLGYKKPRHHQLMFENIPY